MGLRRSWGRGRGEERLICTKPKPVIPIVHHQIPPTPIQKKKKGGTPTTRPRIPLRLFLLYRRTKTTNAAKGCNTIYPTRHTHPRNALRQTKITIERRRGVLRNVWRLHRSSAFGGVSPSFFFLPRRQRPRQAIFFVIVSEQRA